MKKGGPVPQFIMVTDERTLKRRRRLARTIPLILGLIPYVLVAIAFGIAGENDQVLAKKGATLRRRTQKTRFSAMAYFVLDQVMRIVPESD